MVDQQPADQRSDSSRDRECGHDVALVAATLARGHQIADGGLRQHHQAARGRTLHASPEHQDQQALGDARETLASADEIEPWIVAHTLIGLHQTVVDYSRRLILAGTRNPSLTRRVRGHTEQAVEMLARGLNDYGAATATAPTSPAA